MTQPSNSRPVSTGDLLITITGANPGKVDVTVGTDPVARGDVVFEPPFEPVDKSERIRAQMAGATRDAVLRNRARHPAEDMKSVGETLFRALFKTDAVRDRYKDWRKAGGGRIRFRLDAEAAKVAWELLRSDGFFLAVEPDKLLVREVESRRGRREPTAVPAGALRVLACLASPNGLSMLDVAGERKFLEETLQGAGTVDFAPDNATDLREKLSDPKADYHVFHFGGHGSADESGGRIYLARKNAPPDGTAASAAVGRPGLEYDEISAETLANDLRWCQSLRLVVLNACEGAKPDSAANAVSLAQRLVEAGIPAVLAMQSPILDDTAKEIVRTFYRKIARDEPIERAVNGLRSELLAAKLEWAAPVLTMSHPETPLFEVFDPKEQAAEEEARKKAEAEEAASKKAEAEEAARKRAEAEEAARKRAEAEEAARKKAEAEEEAKKKAEAEEAARKIAEEAARRRAEEEAKKKAIRRTIAIVVAVLGLLGLAVLVLAYLSFGPDDSGQFQVTSVTPPPSGAPTAPALSTATSSAPVPTSAPVDVPTSSAPSGTPATVTATTTTTSTTKIVCKNTGTAAASASGYVCSSCPAAYRGCTKAGTINGVTTYRCKSCQ